MKEIFKRANQYLLFAILGVIVLYYGKTFLIPFVFAAHTYGANHAVSGTSGKGAAAHGGGF